VAIKQISISLIGNYSDGRNVGVDDFKRPLSISKSDQIVKVTVDRGPWANGVVVFMRGDIRSYASEPDPDEAFEKEIQDVCEYVAGWLAKRTTILHKMISARLDLFLLIDMWITQNQMDLDLPPSLLLVCGESKIKIQLITND